jgi:hypothetical protein
MSTNKTKLITNDDEKTRYKPVSLFLNPIITIFTLIEIILEKTRIAINYVMKRTYIIFLVVIIICLNYFNNPFTPQIKYYREVAYSCTYWLLLGVASSIGLGTGLHTFVLYLGPHIAKVTLAANECAYFPEFNPSRWNFQDFLPCRVPRQEESYNGFLSIFFNVQIEALMWGIGTAIGELPPYFMALGASKAGQQNEELDEIKEIEAESGDKQVLLMDKLKLFIYKHLQRHGFITVLLCASVSYIFILNKYYFRFLILYLI